jgi:hypothetical protein
VSGFNVDIITRLEGFSVEEPPTLDVNQDDFLGTDNDEEIEQKEFTK